MRAAMCAEHGSPDVVSVEELPSPDLADGQVRIAVHAAAVNFPDVLVVADKYQISLPPPFVPGSEYAGVVTDVAPGVTTPAVGERVFGAALMGAFAEEIAANAASVTRIPDGVDFREASAFGVAHRTAYYALRSFARVQPGDEVVVLGAGGGVGLAAVQLATTLGATVTAVASSPDKLDVARANGASRVVNHKDGDLRAALKQALPDGSDAVLDPVGGTLSEPALRSLHYGGRFVTIGFAAGEIPRIPLNLVLLKGVTISGFEMYAFGLNHAEDLQRYERELIELLASRRVVPHIGASFPLSDVADALRLVGDGLAIGKVVIDVR
jgi:NADPH2:quinone reductase